ncbi:MAG: T9SS type A sorting domain-containing protein [Bacteroidota bacterium]
MLNRRLKRRIDEPTFTGNIHIPNRLKGKEIYIQLSAIYFNPETNQEVFSELSDIEEIVIGCDSEFNEGIETRSDLSNFQDHIFIEGLYPNPTNGRVWIDVNNWHEDEQIAIRVLDKYGRRMAVTWNNVGKEDDQISIDLTPFPSGIYIIELRSGESIYQTKIVKQ